MVYDVPLVNPLNIEFRSVLSAQNFTALLFLVERLMSVLWTNEPDKFIWSLTPPWCFPVKSLHAYLLNGHMVFIRKYIWTKGFAED
jgi:hypothetical protein